MALNPLMLIRLYENMKPGQAIAAMGYPDIIFEPEAMREMLGDKILALKYRPDSEAICKRHGIASREVPDAESFFEQFGCSLDVFDVVQERGCEILCDLNYPVDEKYVGQFDYVLDVGTMEHCFNAPQALVNMASMLKIGGLALHENPFNWGNHGFWNLNPTLFYDFYGDNGFKVLECKILPRKMAEIWEAPPTGRFVYTDKEANLFTVAEKIEKKPVSFPTQTKYRR